LAHLRPVKWLIDLHNCLWWHWSLYLRCPTNHCIYDNYHLDLWNYAWVRLYFTVA